MASSIPAHIQEAIAGTRTALREANSFQALDADNFPVMAAIRAGIKATADFFLRVDEHARGSLTHEELIAALSPLRSLAHDRRVILEDACRRGKAVRVSLAGSSELKLRYTVQDFRIGRSFRDYIRDVTDWVQGELAGDECADLPKEVRDDVFFNVLSVGIKDEFMSYFEEARSGSDRQSLEAMEAAWLSMLKDRDFLARLASG